MNSSDIILFPIPTLQFYNPFELTEFLSYMNKIVEGVTQLINERKNGFQLDPKIHFITITN